VQKIKIGVYVDFDNVWGGILRAFGIDPEERQKKYGQKGITTLEREYLKRTVEVLFPKLFFKSIAEHYYFTKGSVYDDILKIEVEKATRGEVRYVKAFSTFSKLPFHSEIGNIPAMLHKYGIEPFNSFLAKNEKDASDRTLILEVIEDIFFNKLPIDHVVIIGGDIDFYPLFSFFYEHSEKNIYIASFKNSISNYYFQIPLTSNRVIILDNLPFEVEGKKTVGDFIKNEREKLKNEEEKRYQTFKDYLLTKYEELSSEGKELNTGFLIKDKELQEKGFKKSIEINIFLDRMKKERIIDILQPDPKIPLRGKIIIKGG